MTDGWIEWNGGECPVPEDAVIEAELRGLDIYIVRGPGGMEWHHDGADGDIVRYRVLVPDQSDRIAELEAENKRLREALEPFSDAFREAFTSTKDASND